MMTTATESILRELVQAATAFRQTPVVDDAFPMLRDRFDDLLSRAEKYIQETLPKERSRTVSVDPGESWNKTPVIHPETVTVADAQKMVLAFHQKHGIPWGLVPGQNPKADMIRAHLIAEELGEFCLALADKDIVKMADGIGDLVYVVLGAAVTYGLPIQELFLEIQRSNMTKAAQKNRDIRIRDKGPDYSPPDIQSVLRKFDPALLGISDEQA